MRFKPALAASALTIAIALGGCASTQPGGLNAATATAYPQDTLSPAARSTAVLGQNGKAVGISAYPAPIDAVKAGDMAAFLVMTQGLDPDDRNSNPFFNAFLALDRAAAGDTAGARSILNIQDEVEGAEAGSNLYAYLDAWFLAMDEQPDEAIERHRSAASGMPGLTGELSLAAMLEAIGRPEQALAVYDFSHAFTD